jgi:hypothetical protein
VLEVAQVEAKKLGKSETSRVADRYRFALRSDAGEELAVSPSFDTLARYSKTPGQPPQNQDEQRTLEQFVNALRREGWHVVNQQQAPWYAIQLARGTESDISTLRRDLFVRQGMQATPLPPTKRDGLSVQAMWAITLLVIIALFAFCVVLALTAELRITPGG